MNLFRLMIMRKIRRKKIFATNFVDVLHNVLDDPNDFLRSVLVKMQCPKSDLPFLPAEGMCRFANAPIIMLTFYHPFVTVFRT